jgi:hypothetical protein
MGDGMDMGSGVAHASGTAKADDASMVMSTTTAVGAPICPDGLGPSGLGPT